MVEVAAVVLVPLVKKDSKKQGNHAISIGDDSKAVHGSGSARIR
jgi:hypothetical protein